METGERGEAPAAAAVNVGAMIETRWAARPGRLGVAGKLALTLAALIVLGWGMGVIVVHVAPGVFHRGLDRPVNRWFRRHQVGLITKAMARVSPFGSTPGVLVVVLVVAAVLAARRHRAFMVTLLLAYGGGTGIALAVKLLVRKGQAGVPAGLSGISHLAFPSGHSTLSAAVYGTMAVLLAAGAPGAATPNGRRLRSAGALVLVGLTLAIGVSRVYRGQHDPTDVIAGWLLGALWARALTSAWFAAMPPPP